MSSERYPIDPTIDEPRPEVVELFRRVLLSHKGDLFFYRGDGPTNRREYTTARLAAQTDLALTPEDLRSFIEHSLPPVLNQKHRFMDEEFDPLRQERRHVINSALGLNISAMVELVS